MFMFSFCILRRIVIPASSFDGKVKFLEKTRKSFGGGTFNISEGALLESYYSFLKEEYNLWRKAQAVLCCWVHWLTTTHEWLLVSFKGGMLCSVICVSIDLPTSRAQNFSRAQSVSFTLGTTTVMRNENWRTLRTAWKHKLNFNKMLFGLDHVIIYKNKVTESLLIVDETEAWIVIVIFYHFCEETLIHVWFVCCCVRFTCKVVSYDPKKHSDSFLRVKHWKCMKFTSTVLFWKTRSTALMFVKGQINYWCMDTK